MMSLTNSSDVHISLKKEIISSNEEITIEYKPEFL